MIQNKHARQAASIALAFVVTPIAIATAVIAVPIAVAIGTVRMIRRALNEEIPE